MKKSVAIHFIDRQPNRAYGPELRLRELRLR